MSISPLDLDNVDTKDGILIQRGLQKLGFYEGSFRGSPGPKTKAAYANYRGDGGSDTGGAVPPPSSGVLTYSSKVKAELKFPGPLKKGVRGMKARRIQEWLTFNDFRTAIDDDFGSATERALKDFQTSCGLNATGTVDQDAWSLLTAPMTRAFSSPASGAGGTLSETVLAVANQHLREHPVELGGQNRGPWVRAYMNGNEGNAWPWCAGFVTFVMKQAAQIFGKKTPISGSFSCDVLASQAKDKSRFVSEQKISGDGSLFTKSKLGECCIFLVRRTSSDWTHTGFAFNYDKDTFHTIEGNTNDEGSREGYEVCHRIRGRGKMDFIKID